MGFMEILRKLWAEEQLDPAELERLAWLSSIRGAHGVNVTLTLPGYFLPSHCGCPLCHGCGCACHWTSHPEGWTCEVCLPHSHPCGQHCVKSEG